MLEPWGAASSTSFRPAADETARIIEHARDCLLHGRIGEALAIVDQLHGDQDLDDDARSALALTSLVASLSRGDVRGCAPYAREATVLARQPGMTGARAEYGLGEFTAARAMTDEALAHFRRAGEKLEALGPDAAKSGWWLPWRSGVARIVAAAGDVAEANRLLDAELDEAQALGASYALAYTLRTQAAIAPTPDRIKLLDEALSMLQGRGADRLEAQIRTDLASWLLLLEPDESRRAVELLREAESYARREDQHPLLARTRMLLERLGQRPDGELPGRLAELSAAERRVAHLVVAGKRNREIAAELGVSVKSVEWHVSHILRKLSITSRLQLADALALPTPN